MESRLFEMKRVLTPEGRTMIHHPGRHHRLKFPTAGLFPYRKGYVSTRERIKTVRAVNVELSFGA